MIGKRFRTVLATFLVTTVLVATMAASPLAVASAPAGASADTGIFHGRATLKADAAESGAETFVALVSDADGTIFRSDALEADGAFLVEAPVGSYSVIAGSPDAAYLAEQNVQVKQGVNPAVAIRLNAMQGTGSTASVGGASGGWGTWLIVGVIAVAAYFVIDEVTNDEEEAASPF